MPPSNKGNDEDITIVTKIITGGEACDNDKDVKQYTREVQMVNSIGFNTTQLGNIYNVSKAAMASPLVRLSSGKNFNTPKDGVGEFFAIDRLNRDRRGYEIIRRNIEKGIAIANTAEGIAMELTENFKQLKNLTLEYWDSPVGSFDRTMIENEFDGIVSGMQTIIDNAVFEGRDLMAAGTVTSIMLNPNNISQTFDITYANGDLVDTTALTIDGGVDYAASIAVIDTEYNKNMNYLSKTSGYIYSLNAQVSVTTSMIENSSASEAAINEVDEAKEMKELVTQEIRQQAAISMISQANMMRMSLLKLFDW